MLKGAELSHQRPLSHCSYNHLAETSRQKSELCCKRTLKRNHEQIRDVAGPATTRICRTLVRFWSCWSIVSTCPSANSQVMGRSTVIPSALSARAISHPIPSSPIKEL